MNLWSSSVFFLGGFIAGWWEMGRGGTGEGEGEGRLGAVDLLTHLKNLYKPQALADGDGRTEVPSADCRPIPHTIPQRLSNPHC